MVKYDGVSVDHFNDYFFLLSITCMSLLHLNVSVSMLINRKTLVIKFSLYLYRFWIYELFVETLYHKTFTSFIGLFRKYVCVYIFMEKFYLVEFQWVHRHIVCIYFWNFHYLHHHWPGFHLNISFFCRKPAQQWPPCVLIISSVCPLKFATV